jgi:hypothetical protein
MSMQVRYEYGFNTSGTQQHEVLEFVSKRERPTCRCMGTGHYHGSGLGSPNMEGPYVVLYTEERSTAEVIAKLLTIDGTTNNFPETPMSEAIGYMNKRFAKQAESSPGPEYSGEIGDCPPGDLGNEVR